MDDSKKIIDLVTLNTFKEEILEEVNQKLINLLATNNEVEEFISVLNDYVDAEGDKVAKENIKLNSKVVKVNDKIAKLQNQLNNTLFYLKDKNVGDVIKIKEGNQLADFIIVQKGRPSNEYDTSCDGIWVMRKKYAANKQWNSTNVSCDYNETVINTYLNGDYFNWLDRSVKDCILTVKIPYYSNGSVKTGANGFETKVFIPSHSELGITCDDTNVPVIGSVWEYYSDGYKHESDNNFGVRSIKIDGDETFFGWIETDNSLKFNTSYTSSDNVNPVFILSPNSFAKGDGTFIGYINSLAN